MTDQIEEQILQGCGKKVNKEDENFICGSYNLHPRKFYCEECQARLEQHRKTKKWIEGLIDKLPTTFGKNYKTGEEWNYISKSELKKQISGERLK